MGYWQLLWYNKFCNNFSLFQLNRKLVFTKLLAIIVFHSEKTSELQFRTFFLPYKKSVTEKRTSLNKEWNLLKPYLWTVLLSIPFNKLPWLLELSGTFPVPVRREVELRAPSPPFRAFPDRIFPSTMSLRSPGTSCRPSRDRTRFDRTSMMVSVYPISCRYLQLKNWN